MSDDKGAHGEDVKVTEEQAYNTALVSERATSFTTTPAENGEYWVEQCTNDKLETYELTSRWVELGNITWSVSKTRGSELDYYTLPQALWSKDVVSMAPFKMYAYWRGDMEIQCVLNANKFQIGQLQISFYYAPAFDQDVNVRNNIYNLSQCLHTIITASTNNTATLLIPFKYHKPMLATFAVSGSAVSQQLGYLRIKVLSPLSTPSSTYKGASLTIMARFINSKFTGLLNKSFVTMDDFEIVEHQMFSLLAGAAKAGLAYAVNQTLNCDKPTQVTPPVPFVPWSGHSWCAGTNVYEPTNMLRLDMLGQTEYKNIDLSEDMEIPSIVKVFGLVKNFRWATTQSQGTLLAAFDVSPTWVEDQYELVALASASKLATYAVPPVDVVANLYTYWRGSLRFRFDFVCSQFHTGRLVFAIVPRTQAQMTLEKALSSPYIMFDLQEKQQFIIDAPYMADMPWWPRRYHVSNSSMKEIRAPSKLYVYIINPLIPMDSVSNTIDILVYKAAGSDFEVAVPAAPSIGLGRNPNFLVVGVNKTNVLGGASFYVGTWHVFSSKGKTYAILRWGTASDQVAEFTGGRIGTVYNAKDDKITGADGTHFPFLILWHREGYWYGIPFISEAKAKKFAGSYAITDAELYTQNGGPWVNDKDYEWTASVSVEHQMDERSLVEKSFFTGKPLLSTNYGKESFGENFKSLKDLCRRYQQYADLSFNVPTNGDSYGGVEVPILPHGLDLDIGVGNDIRQVANRCRDGVIPIVANGYRFFRGSIRFRAIFKASDMNKIIFIQHRPDLVFNIHAPRQILNIASARDVFTSGYGFLFQGLLVNQIIEFEVPWYQPGQFGLLIELDKTDEEELMYFSTLGTLLIGCQTPGRINMQLFYSFADDTTFHVFQGFGPMCFPHKIPDAKVEFQMPDYTTTGLFLLGGVSMGLACYGGWRIIKSIEKASQSIETATELLTPETLSEATSGINRVVDESKGWFKKTVLVSALSQVLHVVVNPKIETFVVALSGFFANIGLFVGGMSTTFMNSLRKLLGTLTGIEHHSPGSDSLSSYVSTIVCGISVFIGKSVSLLNSGSTIKNLGKILMTDIKDFCLTANCLTIFIRNNIKVFILVFDWFMRKFYPSYNLATTMVNAPEWMSAWATKSLQYSRPEELERVKMDPEAAIEVYGLATTAIEILAGMKEFKDEGLNVGIITKICSDIIQTRDKLVGFKIAPPVRFEPFLLYMEGAPGVGKSHLSQYIDVELLKAINYQTTSEVRFVVTPGNAYFNGVRNQPVCQFDDFGAVSGDYGDREASLLFNLKSTAIFNPPIAEIENKHIRYNPLLVTVCSNTAFPKSSSVACAEALWRRRDVLVRITNKYGTLDRARSECDIAKYEHLEFQLYDNICVEGQPRTQKMNYEEFFQHVKNSFIMYCKREASNYKLRLQQSRALYPSTDLDIRNDDITRVVETEFQMDTLETMGSHLDDISEIMSGWREVVNMTVDNRAQTDEVRRLREAVADRVNVNCEHRRFIPGVFDFDTEQGYFTHGDDVIRLTDCAENCMWHLSPEIKRLQIRLWVRAHVQILEHTIHMGVYGAEIEAAYDYIHGRRASEVFRVNDLRFWTRMLDKVWGGVKTTLRVLYSMLETTYKCIIFLAPLYIASTVVSMGCVSAYTKISKFFAPTDISPYREFQSSTVAAYDTQTRPRDRRVNRLERGFFSSHQPIEFQSEEILNFIKKCIKRNTFTIVSAGVRMRGLGIMGHYAVVPYHYIEFMSNAHVLIDYIENWDGSRLPISNLDMSTATNTQLVVLKLPLQVPPFKNLINFFVRSFELEKLSRTGHFVCAEGNELTTTILRYDLINGVEVEGNSLMSAIKLSSCTTYEKGAKGDCGCVLLDERLNHCIVSMHVAGTANGKCGYGELLIYERFEKLMNEDVIRDIDTRVEFQCQEITEANLIYGINVMIHGNVPRNLQHNETGKHQFEESITHKKIFPVLTEPGILSPSDNRNIERFSPMREGVRKQEMIPSGFNPEHLALASDVLERYVLTFAKPIRQKVGLLTEEQAVCGIHGIPEYEALEMTTSEGFPFTSYRPAGCTDKRWLLRLKEIETGYVLDSMDPFLRDLIDLSREQRASGVLPEMVFVNNLKQQCLPCDKARQKGKVRIFSGSPLHKTIEDRIYMQDFVVSFHQAMMKIFHAITIDVNSLQWTQLYRHLAAVGSNAIDGDYKSFGPTLDLNCVFEVVKIINAWYKKWSDTWKTSDDKIRKILFYELMYAKYLAFATLYQAFCGAPSGSTLTTLVNTCANILYMLCGVINFISNQMPELGFKRTLSDVSIFVDKEIRFITFGDDIIIFVSDRVKEKFHLRYLEEFFWNHNIVFHSAEKDPTKTYLVRRPSEVTFLKCYFVWNDEYKVMLAKLPEESISNSFNWIWKHPDVVSASLEAAESALPLCLGWGREYYEQLREKLVLIYTNYDKLPRFNKWDDEIKSRYFPDMCVKEVPCLP